MKKYCLKNVTNQENALGILRTYMASGNYTPDDILEKSTINKTELILLPFYKIYGSFNANWTASFGFDREEEYLSTETINYFHPRYYVDKQDFLKTQLVSKVRKVTDWRLVNGNQLGNFEEILYSGTKKIDETIINKIQEIEFDKNLTESYDDSLYIDTKNIESLLQPLRDRIEKIIEKNVKKNAQGDRQKDWSWSFDLKYEHDLYYFPLFECSFEYHGKKYLAWIDGHNSKLLGGESLPVDTSRQIDSISSFIPFILTIITTISINDYFNLQTKNHYQWIPLLISLIFGLMRWHAIFNKSKSIRVQNLRSYTSSENSVPSEIMPSYFGKHLKEHVGEKGEKIVNFVFDKIFKLFVQINRLPVYELPKYAKKENRFFFITLVTLFCCFIAFITEYYYFLKS